MISPKVKRVFKWMERNGEKAIRGLDGLCIELGWYEYSKQIADLTGLNFMSSDFYAIHAAMLTEKYIAEKWISKKTIDKFLHATKERVSIKMSPRALVRLACRYPSRKRIYYNYISALDCVRELENFKKNHPTAEILYFN